MLTHTVVEVVATITTTHLRPSLASLLLLTLAFAACECDRTIEHCRVQRDRKQSAGDDQIQALRGKQAEIYAQCGKDK